MRLVKGETISIEYQVTEADRPAFEGETVHNVCSTYVLCREIEWCTRQFVLKVKNEDEEGIGTSLTIDHLAPALPGEVIVITGTVDMWDGKELICSYEARVGARIVATGKTGQKLLKRQRLAEIFSKFEGNGR